MYGKIEIKLDGKTVCDSTVKFVDDGEEVELKLLQGSFSPIEECPSLWNGWYLAYDKESGWYYHCDFCNMSKEGFHEKYCKYYVNKNEV